MFNGIMPARFQQVIKTDDVAFDIYIRVVDRIAHACLSGEVDHDVEMVLGEQLID